MKQGIFTIKSNEQLTASVWKMVLEGDTSAMTAPGQFVEIALPGTYLRRPISVCDWSCDSLTLIYKVVGKGTNLMSDMAPGTTLDILSGLGNGFEPLKGSEAPVLVGGGVGVPPMFSLAKSLLKAGIRPKVVLGFNTASEVFYKAEFEALGLDVTVSTADGSMGVKGFVTDALNAMKFDAFYACGPIPMLRALAASTSVPGLVSLEERMGCGFGACMGCTHQMKSGPKRICKDGPVFDKEEVIW